MALFTKGQSGNPKGRPKNSISSELRKIVDRQEAARLIWEKAKKGDKWALGMIMDRLEPIQQSLTLKHQAARNEQRQRFDYSKLTEAELATLQGILERAHSGTEAGASRALPAPIELLPGASVVSD